MLLGERGPYERRGKRGAPPLKILPLLACLAWKWLQIGTDKLLIVTSTSDELLSNVNIHDLEWPWTPKIWGLVTSWFRAVTHISRVNCAEMAGDWPRQPVYDFLPLNVDFSRIRSPEYSNQKLSKSDNCFFQVTVKNVGDVFLRQCMYGWLDNTSCIIIHRICCCYFSDLCTCDTHRNTL